MHSPLSFCKDASPYFFHGAFAPSFIWGIDAPVRLYPMLLGFPTTLLNSRIVGGADVQIVGNTDGNGNITNRVFETSLSTRIKAICTYITKKRLIITLANNNRRLATIFTSDLIVLTIS